MTTSPTSYRASGLDVGPQQHGTPGMRTDINTTNRIQGSSGSNVGNVSNSYNNTINVGLTEESLRIQAWLSPLEPHIRHHDVSNRRLEGVGDWVLRKKEFESWRDGRDGGANPTLLCYGGQGVGKTYISSLVIDTLCAQYCGQNTAVLSLYCDYQAKKDQTAVNLIGGLLKQVVVRAREIPDKVRSAFEGLGQRGGKRLRLPDMVKLFVETISSMDLVYICFDAVDELLPEYRSEFLRAVREIIEDSPNTRLFLTWRPYIRKELDKHLTKNAYIIRTVTDQGDIARYISRKMDEDDDRDPDLMTASLKDDFIKTLSERSSDMFLLVALNIDAILGQTSRAKRREVLQNVAVTGIGLDRVYAQILERIREQKGDRSRLGMDVLMWVSHSERPLRIDELRHALEVDMEKRDLDPEDIPPQDTILGSCLGLAVVDNETSTIRLIHYTLQEYLSRPGILPDAHKRLAESCLTYLHYEQVSGLPARDFPNLGDMPFLQYSSLYWGIHAKMELSDRAKWLALQLLSRSGDHVSVTLLFNQILEYHPCLSRSHLFPSLHYASYFGIVEVVAALIQVNRCDINQKDCVGFTPLTWAARQGNEQVVGLLLAQDDVNPDRSGDSGQTPLWWASRNGHEGVVRLLLTQGDVNPDGPGSSGQSPLWQASCNGHEGVVRLLLALDGVNPDRPDDFGQTPLCRASVHGHEGVVGTLLARGDVDPDRPGNDGQTPLWSAAFGGHEGVVRLLLARDDVNPNRKAFFGYSPLMVASINGYGGAVRALLARGDVNPDEPDSIGKTPLWWASSGGDEGLVRLLLAFDGVNPDRPDRLGRTPLWWACRNGHGGVVGLLLARGDVNPDRPDNRGQTAWRIACESRRTDILALFQHRTSVKPSLDQT